MEILEAKIIYLTEQKQRSIVESKMDTGTIKLGANKELSRKVLPSIQLEGFFYGGGVVAYSEWVVMTGMQLSRPTARQHLILQTICAGVDNVVSLPQPYDVIGLGRIERRWLTSETWVQIPQHYCKAFRDNNPAPAHLFFSLA